jgi:hypothetical protein
MTSIGCVYCPTDTNYRPERIYFLDGCSVCDGCLHKIQTSYEDADENEKTIPEAWDEEDTEALILGEPQHGPGKQFWGHGILDAPYLIDWECVCGNGRWYPERGCDPVPYDKKYCSCTEGPMLGTRSSWAKPRCARCSLFVRES